ncbi:hypothetical protein CHISP_0145 [Chitinispirillum alkaliphilum]|nr:hypothetical protein CHISP_0145 [Chitinispirillum alkaliphilum]
MFTNRYIPLFCCTAILCLLIFISCKDASQNEPLDITTSDTITTVSCTSDISEIDIPEPVKDTVSPTIPTSHTDIDPPPPSPDNQTTSKHVPSQDEKKEPKTPPPLPSDPPPPVAPVSRQPMRSYECFSEGVSEISELLHDGKHEELIMITSDILANPNLYPALKDNLDTFLFFQISSWFGIRQYRNCLNTIERFQKQFPESEYGEAVQTMEDAIETMRIAGIIEL